jgi:hypothetical protein
MKTNGVEMNKTKCLLMSSILLITNYAQSEVPHIFQSGAPARADEVNANFADLDRRVSAADNTPPVIETISSELDEIGLSPLVIRVSDNDELAEIKIVSTSEIFGMQSGPEGVTSASAFTGVTVLAKQNVSELELNGRVSGNLDADTEVFISATDVSGNMSKSELIIPVIDTGFYSGNYVLASPIILPVATIDDEAASISFPVCFSTPNGAPVLESVSLSQNLNSGNTGLNSGAGVGVQLTLQLSNGGNISLGGLSTLPLSNPITFAPRANRRGTSTFGQIIIATGGSVQQSGPEELLFEASVSCDLNGTIYEYQISGSASLDTSQ